MKTIQVDRPQKVNLSDQPREIIERLGEMGSPSISELAGDVRHLAEIQLAVVKHLESSQEAFALGLQRLSERLKRLESE